MHSDFSNRDLQTLLTLYNQEIDSLKEKLLSGESWENVKPVRKNITELAIAIHKLHGYVVPKRVNKGNHAESSQFDKFPDQPVE